MMKDDDCKACFETVLGDELDLLDALRSESCAGGNEDVYKRAHDSQLVGLAFSGGGIRSATFNLGVIQALASYGLLARFDYLSTVSGGGYIGGWLSALLHRSAQTDKKTVNQQFVEEFQASLRPHPANTAADEIEKTSGFPPVEHIAVRYLRRYSNYLTPQLGLSGDTLAVVSIFLRNFMLMQLALISMVASIMLLAHIVGAASMAYVPDASSVITAPVDPAQTGWLQWALKVLSLAGPFVASVLALFVSVWWAGRHMKQRRLPDAKRIRASRAVHYHVIAPCLLAAWWFSIAIIAHPNESLAGNDPFWQAVVWITVPATCYAGAWLLGFFSREGSVKTGESGATLTLLVSTVCSGVLFGLLLNAAHNYIADLSTAIKIDVWHAVGFGTPLFLLLLSSVVALHIGMVRHIFSEDDREWLARLGGFILLYAAGWAILFALVLYATPLIDWLANGGLVALITWATASGLGAKFARGSSTNGVSDENRWKSIIALVAPWVFVAGLAVIVTYATQVALFKILLTEGFVKSPTSDFYIAASNLLLQLKELPVTGTLWVTLGASVLFVLISWRLDINLFSMHGLYCNRLARAYLGASRAGEREPNPFTGFDIEDDLQFADLDNQRPIHIVNTAINMTGGDDLAWQTRRAASFSFTPCWSGYETLSSQGVKLGKFRQTSQYAQGRSLGTWVSVSGAAASPNMGYHTSAAVAALMTAFNLRLGRWCGNPDPVNKDSTVWKHRSPCFAAQPMISELTGSANTQSNWINLTDGGHFENLGVYELIRRRCRLIVVTDVGCDPKHQFEDLANMIRKCWTDFGVNVRFEKLEPMHLKKSSRCCGAYGAVGRIQYKDGGNDGAIIYLKASMTGDEWADIRQYGDSHGDFPHETTADQFFDENQFESYRHLGYKVVAKFVVTLEALLHEQKKQEQQEQPEQQKQELKNIPTAELVEMLKKIHIIKSGSKI